MKKTKNSQTKKGVDNKSKTALSPDYGRDFVATKKEINQIILFAIEDLSKLKREILFPKDFPKVTGPHEYVLSYINTLYNLASVFTEIEVTRETIQLSKNLEDVLILIRENILQKDLQKSQEKRFIGYLSLYLTCFGIGKDEAKDQVKIWYGFNDEKSVRDRRQLLEFDEESIKDHYEDQVTFLKEYNKYGCIIPFIPYEDDLYKFTENIGKLSFLNSRTRKATGKLASHIRQLKNTLDEYDSLRGIRESLFIKFISELNQ